MKRIHYLVSGEVQGVGFRHRATRIADRLELTGWVKNLWDGRVEMEAQGDENHLNRFLSDIEESCYIEIRKVEKIDLPVIDGEYGFGVRY